VVAENAVHLLSSAIGMPFTHSSMSSDLDSSEEDHQYQIEYAEYKRRYAEYEEECAARRCVLVQHGPLLVLLTHTRKRKEEVLRKAEALQSKRDQWKAASARYYERHPEVKEKKRIKAAEQR
jgi:hypothetical protein